MDFEQLLKTCYDDAVRFAYSLSGSKQDCDDLLQEALVKTWVGFPRLRDHDRFKSWLLTIISNTHRTIWRRGWARRMVGLDAVAELESAPGLPYEEKEVVRLALKQLPRVQREAIVLFEILGLSVAETAAVQKVTQSAIKSRLARGRARLSQNYHALSNQETYHEAEVVQAG